MTAKPEQPKAASHHLLTENARLREALHMARVDLKCLADYDGLSIGAKVVAQSAHDDLLAALSERTE